MDERHFGGGCATGLGMEQMGSRCCYAAVALVLLSLVMWITWCLLGLTAVHVSEGQRRALVNYSAVVKPLHTPSTPAPGRTSTLAVEETSANSISKLPTTASVEPKKKEHPNATQDKANEEDRIYARRVAAPGPENRPEEEKVPDISPTKSSPPEPEADARSDSRGGDKVDLPRTDDIQGSLRSEPGYRDPDFDRERPRSRAPDRERPAYDDLDDDRGSRRRYENRDKGRQSDDRYAKGDSRVYPDRVEEKYPEDNAKRGDDDRYKDRDDRLRPDARDSPRSKDLDYKPLARDDRYRDEERYRARNDDRYNDRDDERYRSRDDERYRYRDDDRYKTRDDDRYKTRDDDRYKSRDDDRYRDRDDDRFRSRDDERYRSRGDERYRSPDDDRYRSRGDDRYRTDVDDRRDSSLRVGDDRYYPDDKYVAPSISRVRETDVKVSSSRSSVLPAGDRKPASSRYEYSLRREDTASDFGIPPRESSRSYESSSRLPRPVYADEDRYRERSRDDEYKRPSRYEDDRADISPTRTRPDSLPSRSFIDSKEDSRYVNIPRDRAGADDRYYDEDTRLRDSRSPSSISENSRRYTDDEDKYRTRLPNERAEDSRLNDRKEEVVLDRRSYASEDGYRRRDSEQSNDERKPIDDTRKRDRDDEYYSRRYSIDDNRRTSDYDRDRSKRPDRYDDDYRRYDDRYEDRYSSRDLRPSSQPARRYDPGEDERPRRRDSVPRPDDSRDREESLKPTREEGRLYNRDERVESKPPPRRRDDSNNRDYSESRRYSEEPRRPKEPMLGSSMTREPTEVVVREKRYQSSRSYNDESVRPLSAKDVIEAAIRHSDASDPNARKVYYPVFDPRLSNLTSPEIIRPSERRGTTITARRRRFAML